MVKRTPRPVGEVWLNANPPKIEKKGVQFPFGIAGNYLEKKNHHFLPKKKMLDSFLFVCCSREYKRGGGKIKVVFRFHGFFLFKLDTGKYANFGMNVCLKYRKCRGTQGGKERVGIEGIGEKKCDLRYNALS